MKKMREKYFWTSKHITNDKKNILLFKYDYFSVKVFIYFLIPFYILGILAITIFWKTKNIDKILTIALLFIIKIAGSVVHKNNKIVCKSIIYLVLLNSFVNSLGLQQ